MSAQALKRLARRWVLPFVDPRRIASAAMLPRFMLDWRRYRALGGTDAAWVDLHPCLADRYSHTPIDPHYLYQGAWLARRIAAAQPALHVDIASSVSMVSVLSANVPIVFVDLRPLNANLTGVHCVAANATRLPVADASLTSVSSLHVVEHVGLGRYGDPLDPDGTRSAVQELGRVIAPGGTLYLSAPVGRERVCFNAHRVLNPRTLLSWLPRFSLAAMALVDDDGRFAAASSIGAADGLDYGCGMLELTRNA